MDKASLRRAVRAALRLRDPKLRHDESRLLMERIAALMPRGLVLAYVPLPEEPELSPWLADLAAAGRLVLPRVTPAGLTLHRVVDLSDLHPGPLGLREPSAALPACNVEDLALAAVLTPGLAFDRRGARLGRGAGYYDRLLATLGGRVPTFAAIFAEQLVREVPEQAHDQRVGTLILPDAVLRCAPHDGEAPISAPSPAPASARDQR